MVVYGLLVSCDLTDREKQIVKAGLGDGDRKIKEATKKVDVMRNNFFS